MSISACIKSAACLSAILLAACTQQSPSEIDVARRIASTEKRETSGKAFLKALNDAQADKREGFLALYDISKNPDIYTVEYQEAANDALTELLYTKTEAWVKAFASVSDFKFSFGVLPEEIPEAEYNAVVLTKLNKIQPNEDERKLIAYMKSKL